MSENGTQQGPRPHEHYAPGVANLDLPDLAADGIVAHYPAQPLLMEVPGGGLRLRQVCGWCGELLIEEDHAKPTGLVVPGRAGPTIRHLPLQRWVALFEVSDEEIQMQVYDAGVRPGEACMWLDYPRVEDEAG